MSKSPGRKRVLLVEDDPRVMESLKGIIGRFGTDVEAVEANDAGKALEILRSRKKAGMHLDAMILDVMMPYGEAEEELGGEKDRGMDDAGLHLLEMLRQEEVGKGLDQLWVGVVTARIRHAVLQRIRELIGKRGRLYPKPFSTFLLQHHLSEALGIESRVPPALLP